MNSQIEFPKPRPFLKWVGGKGQLLPELLNLTPKVFNAYYEPFVGGGALFFELSSLGLITQAYLSDVNQSLIDVYIALRDQIDEVIEILKEHIYNEIYYYRIRALKPETLSLPERAARIIFLNKTCFNGLYRENRAGEFNVPFGKHKNPKICDEPNLRAVSLTLKNVDLSCHHFSKVLDCAKSGDLVYFDPPYHPVSATSNFTAYDRNGFSEKDQIHLRDVFDELTKKNITVLLSNSDSPFIRKLYSNHFISQVYASRSVNSKADSRGKVPEVIVSNRKLAIVPRKNLDGKNLFYSLSCLHVKLDASTG